MDNRHLQARMTSKGLRVFLEGSYLTEAGFNHKVGYDISLYPVNGKVIIDLNSSGKRKVAGSIKRPVIDLQSKKLSTVFTEGKVEVIFNHGKIEITQEV